MSALEVLVNTELKAPAGQFIITKFDAALSSEERVSEVSHPKQWEALDARRRLSARRESPHVSYSIRNDEGREVGVLGTRIAQEERVAPAGKFRVVCVDFCFEPATVWLVADYDDKEKATEYAAVADEGPYTGFQVHDDTGAALLK